MVARSLGVVVAIALCLPAAASASAPSAWTVGWHNVSATATDLHGRVNTGGEPTAVHFEYAPAASEFCASWGESGASQTTASAPVPYDGDLLEARASGLTPGTETCFRIVATNASGSVSGGMATFTAGAPEADTDPQRNVGAGSAVLQGWVDPADQDVEYWFEYGPAGSGCAQSTTPHRTIPAFGWGGRSVGQLVEGLTPGTTYCFRVHAVTATGATNAGSQVFVAGMPQMVSEAATVTGPTTATASVLANPAGQDAQYRFEWDTASSFFCEARGEAGEPANTTPSEPLAGVAGETRIAATLEGLSPGVEYCFRPILTNGTGTTEHNTWHFVAGAPSVGFPSAVSRTTSATVRNSVHPGGASTRVVFRYAPAGSRACATREEPSPQTAPVHLPGDLEEHEVTATITGLTPDTTYCLRTLADNGRAVIGWERSTTFTTRSADPPVRPPSRPPLLESLDVPARQVSRRLAAVRGSVDVGVPGATLATTIFRRAATRPIGRLRQALGAAGSHRFKVRLGKAARRALSKRAAVRLRVKIELSAAGMALQTHVRHVRLARRGWRSAPGKPLDL